MKPITKLAITSVRSHRVRSAVVCAAVILTSVLFMTVISITFTIFGSGQLMLMLAGGSDFHSTISTYGFTLTPRELLEKIELDKTVKEAYLLSVLGSSDFDGKEIPYLYSINSPKALPHFFITVTDGVFPKSSGELALNKSLYPDVTVGQKLTLNFDNIVLSDDDMLTQREYNRDYTVSALFESEADNQMPALTLYDDTADAGETGIYLCWYNSLNIAGKHEALTESIGELVVDGGTLNAQVNNAYLSADSSMFNAANIFTVVFSVLVIFFCAFLLIYNIYSIALTQDMRSFGLLEMIGTTYRQLRSMILRQTLILYVLSAPFGIAAGYFFGWKLLAPVFMSLSGQDLKYRFNIWIIAISAALTLLTLLYSALRPLSRLQKLTPVEAVNGENISINKKVKKPSSVTPVALAISSVARNPKRLIVTSLSAALSVILLLVISMFVTLVSDIGANELTFADIELYAAYDREIVNSGTNTVQTLRQSLQLGSADGVIDEAVLDELSHINEISELYTLRFAETDITASENNIADASALLAQIPEQMREYNNTGRLEQIASGTVHAIFLSVPDELCKYIRTDKDVFYSGGELYDGSHAISVDNYNAYYINDGDTYIDVRLPRLFGVGDVIRSGDRSGELTVITGETQLLAYTALSKLIGAPMWEYGTQLFILPESVFTKRFGEGKIYSILCNGADGQKGSAAVLSDVQKRLRDEIEKLAAKYTVKNDEMTKYIEVSGRLDGLEELQSRIFAISLTGYSLCAVIFIIGLINMINSSLSTVIERRREYAMLEAVGMTGGQLKIMMLTEGLIGGALAAAISLIIGLPAVKLFLQSLLEGMNINALPVFIMLVVLIAASLFTSLISFGMLRAAPVTERLRQQ